MNLVIGILIACVVALFAILVLIDKKIRELDELVSGLDNKLGVINVKALDDKVNGVIASYNYINDHVNKILNLDDECFKSFEQDLKKEHDLNDSRHRALLGQVNDIWLKLDAIEPDARKNYKKYQEDQFHKMVKDQLKDFERSLYFKPAEIDKGEQSDLTANSEMPFSTFSDPAVEEVGDTTNAQDSDLSR